MAKKSSTSPRILLTPAGLHVLMSLADGVRHGYGVKRDVEEATGGTRASWTCCRTNSTRYMSGCRARRIALPSMRPSARAQRL